MFMGTELNKDKKLIYERAQQIDWEQWRYGKDPYTEIDNAAYIQAAESVRRMKAKGYAITDIIEITGLTAEEIEAL